MNTEINQIKETFKSIGAFLKEKNMLNSNEFPDLFEEKDKESLRELFLSSYTLKKEIFLKDSSFKEGLPKELWMSSFETVRSRFNSTFEFALLDGNNVEAIEIINDYASILKDLVRRFPCGGSSHIYASSMLEDVAKEDGLSELEEELEDDPGNKPDKSEKVLELRSELDEIEEEKIFEIEISASAASNNISKFERKIKGILFPVDKESEAIPNIGPGCPLYIPRKVAIEALKQITPDKPKPLDVYAYGFDRHNKENIVGVMTGASIVDDNFVIEGVLWQSNKEKDIQAISANRERLGMSVNAYARGHYAMGANGKRMWQIDVLEISGANILFSDKATFTGTRIIEANCQSNQDDLIPVAAAAKVFDATAELNSENYEEIKTMENEQLNRVVDNLGKILTASEEQQKLNEQRWEKSENALSLLNQKIQEISLELSATKAKQEEREEKEEQQLSLAARQEIEKKKKVEKDNFLKQIQRSLREEMEEFEIQLSQISDKLSSSVEDMDEKINNLDEKIDERLEESTSEGLRPAARQIPLAASGTFGESSFQNSEDEKLKRIEYLQENINNNPSDFTAIWEITQEIADIKKSIR